MKLDSVGTYQGYHGDVGRTVVVGEPTDELSRRIEADTKCSRLVYEAIRPGMLFTEATAMFADLMQQEGFAAVSSPHCVGLNHTDQPFYTVEPFQQALGRDWTFEAGTVFTLDMPHNEIGWGTTHVENMILVKESGYEGLSSMDTSLRIRPVQLTRHTNVQQMSFGSFPIKLLFSKFFGITRIVCKGGCEPPQPPYATR